jgi:hypothetical protein
MIVGRDWFPDEPAVRFWTIEDMGLGYTGASRFRGCGGIADGGPAGVRQSAVERRARQLSSISADE